jgi:hypothetical protein
LYSAVGAYYAATVLVKLRESFISLNSERHGYSYEIGCQISEEGRDVLEKVYLLHTGILGTILLISGAVPLNRACFAEPYGSRQTGFGQGGYRDAGQSPQEWQEWGDVELWPEHYLVR